MIGPAPSRTAAAIGSRRRATQNKIGQVEGAITRLIHDYVVITFPAVAPRAGVSRTFLYKHSDARSLVEAALHQTVRPTNATSPDGAAETTRRECAPNAEDSLSRPTRRSAHSALTSRNCWARKEIWSMNVCRRLLPGSPKNNQLKQRLRQAEAESRTLQERIQAVRSNLRF
ncbi:DUF6262 family protein [Streptomyces sp. NPDC052051]|uniref:DUF6262 family protein n=1 Tax=Streptomyces sp. NPDC052051 TaxID=3154649 RepID=UPI00341C4A96